MGRRRNIDSIEAKIQKAQQKVSVTCDRYEAATAELVYNDQIEHTARRFSA